MAIQLHCPQCSKPLHVRDEFAGKTGKCPRCRSNVKIPKSSSPPPARPSGALNAYHGGSGIATAMTGGAPGGCSMANPQTAEIVEAIVVLGTQGVPPSRTPSHVLTIGNQHADYYLADDGQRRGPFSFDQLASANIQPTTLIWHQGLAGWKLASAIKSLQGLPRLPPSEGAPPRRVGRDAPATSLTHPTTVAPSKTENSPVPPTRQGGDPSAESATGMLETLFEKGLPENPVRDVLKQIIAATSDGTVTADGASAREGRATREALEDANKRAYIVGFSAAAGMIVLLIMGMSFNIALGLALVVYGMMGLLTGKLALIVGPNSHIFLGWKARAIGAIGLGVGIVSCCAR